MQLVTLLVCYVVTVPPAYIIIRRIGNTKWLALFLVVPLLGLALVAWIIALSRWPAADKMGRELAVRTVDIPANALVESGQHHELPPKRLYGIIANRRRDGSCALGYRYAVDAPHDGRTIPPLGLLAAGYQGGRGGGGTPRRRLKWLNSLWSGLGRCPFAGENEVRKC